MKEKLIYFEKTCDAIPNAIVIMDEKGKVFRMNHAAGNLFAVGTPISKKSARAKLDQEIEQLIKQNEKDDQKAFEIRGKKYILSATRLEVGDFQGKLVMFAEMPAFNTVFDELSETRSLKNELDKIIDGSYDYIFVTDAAGNVKRINDAYTRITGYKAEEIMGSNIYDLVKKGYFDRAASIDVIKSHQTETFTQTLKSGKTVLVTGNPLFSENGEFIGVVTNGRDITELNRLKSEVKKAEGLSQHYQNELLKYQLDKSGDYIVASPQMAEISDLIKRIARVDSTVLINGESGVGKEIVAREIHRNSLRVERPYISVNCAAIPDNLLESELFGYDGGAFTGANKGGKMGIFQLADSGTLFLDEIGELPFYLQAKLLRVIQENEIMRVGGTAPIPINVRLITATNRDLWKMVNERQFREDLYYRLNVVQVRIPPLRERKEEIPVFMEYFIGLLNKKYGLNRNFNPELLEGMMQYAWPGNIRELRNALEQAFVTTSGDYINNIKLGPTQEVNVTAVTKPGRENKTPRVLLKEALQHYERQIIKDAMETHITTRKAAAALGVSQATIWRKAKQYGIVIKEEAEPTD